MFAWMSRNRRRDMVCFRQKGTAFFEQRVVGRLFRRELYLAAHSGNLQFYLREKSAVYNNDWILTGKSFWKRDDCFGHHVSPAHDTRLL